MPKTIAIDARQLRVEPAGSYVRNLLRTLASEDGPEEFVVLVGPNGTAALPRLSDRFRVVVDSTPCNSLRELLTWSWKLFRLRADLYHATHYFLPLWVPGRSIVTVHDVLHLLYPAYVPGKLGGLYAERIVRVGLRRADRVIATTQSARNDLVRTFRVDPRKIEVVHNGIDDSFREPIEDDVVEGWLNRLGVERPYVVALASSGSRPNLDLVVRAYARALETADLPERLVLLGDRGRKDFKIRSRVESLGLGDRVILLGDVAREALPPLYRGARLFLWPNLEAEIGRPALEAMAAGVPVVSTSTSTLKEIAAGYAHLVGPLDVEGTSEAIVQCLTDDAHHGSLSRLGARRARDFDWDSTGRQTAELYRQLLAGDEEDGA